MTDEEIVRDPNRPLPERIAAGGRLWHSISASNAALDVLKADLRKVALEGHPNPGNVTIDGEGLSSALVVIAAPLLALKKGADPGAYRTSFGRSFGLLFEETRGWKLRNPDTAPAIVKRLPARLRELVFRLVEESDPKPRVFFSAVGKGVESL